MVVYYMVVHTRGIAVVIHEHSGIKKSIVKVSELFYSRKFLRTINLLFLQILSVLKLISYFLIEEYEQYMNKMVVCKYKL